MSDYIPVPVSAAKEITDQFEKSIAIIATWDQAHGLLHVTTYGVNESEKAWAASGGEIVAKALGSMPDQAIFFENYQKHCCVASGHVTFVPERECRGCGMTAAECEARPVGCGTFGREVEADSGPCCAQCFHQAVRCVAHPFSANGERL